MSISAQAAEWLSARYLDIETLSSVEAALYDTQVSFPIWSPSGVPAFILTRHFDDTAVSKYALNPMRCRPSYTLYLYAQHFQRIMEEGYVIVVEGIADALALRRAGFVAVSAFGCDLSRVQIALLSMVCTNVVIWGDGDKSGEEFILKNMSAPGLDVSGVWVEGEDPASYLAAHDGVLTGRLLDSLLGFDGDVSIFPKGV